MEMIKQIPGIKDVVIQSEIMYDEIFDTLKPDFVVHGDNWKEGPLTLIRDNVLDLLERNGGQLIEVPYTYNENVARIEKRMKEKLAMPEY